MKRLRIFIALLTAGMLLSGCGSLSEYSTATGSTAASAAGEGDIYRETYSDADTVYMNSDSVATEETTDYEAEDSALLEDDAAAAGADAAEKDRKLVTTMHLSMETKKFDKAYAGLKTKVDELGGWVAGDYLSSSYRYGESSERGGEVRYVSMTLRIPSGKLDSFLEYADSATNVTSKSSTTEDVTLRYTDISAKIQAKETEVAKLQSFMEEAENVEDLLAIEERLSDAQYELDSARSQLKVLSGQISYSEVSVDLQEVLTYTETEPRSDLERIREGFLQNLNDVIYELKELFIAFVTHLPELVVVVLALIVLAVLLRRFRRGKEARAQRREGRRAGKAKVQQQDINPQSAGREPKAAESENHPESANHT